MLPENNLAISMLNDMKKIDDDIRSELEKMKLENRSGDDEKTMKPTRSTKTTTATTNTPTTPTKASAASNSNSRQRIKIQNLDAYLKSTSSDMMLTLMDEDDSNEFYRLPSSLSTSAKIITSLDTTTSTLTNKESGNNVYEKLSDVTSTVVRPTASNNAAAIISTISKLNDENGEVEVEIRKEQPTAAANIDSDKKNNSLYDFLTLNLDRYCYNLYYLEHGIL